MPYFKIEIFAIFIYLFLIKVFSSVFSFLKTSFSQLRFTCTKPAETLTTVRKMFKVNNTVFDFALVVLYLTLSILRTFSSVSIANLSVLLLDRYLICLIFRLFFLFVIFIISNDFVKSRLKVFS